ncbi:MAG: lipoyl(octanoyl) transferase LipB [Cytophagaceae bacterium]|jgi:lipoyl(octanoyl) transferase|nr:lipoyl(octanoyl) transferase LipB [Cytophagaceae bacterium]
MPEQVVTCIPLGLIDYKIAWDFQTSLFDSIVSRKLENRHLTTPVPTENFLIVCEHPHVYTLGRNGHKEHLLLESEGLEREQAQFYEINRGGDITYHGPGQLVLYPVMDLENFYTDIHRYMRELEEVVIRTLADSGVTAGRLSGMTGVWLDPEIPGKARKICAMGVKTSRWVTMHGLALNLTTNLSYFQHIVPCGIKDKDVTSLHLEIPHVDIEKVKEDLLKNFQSVFHCLLVPPDHEDVSKRLLSLTTDAYKT